MEILKVESSDVDSFYNPWEMAPMQEGGWGIHGLDPIVDGKSLDVSYPTWLDFTSSDHFEGHWIWIETHGWLWTQENMAFFILIKLGTGCIL